MQAVHLIIEYTDLEEQCIHQKSNTIPRSLTPVYISCPDIMAPMHDWILLFRFFGFSMQLELVLWILSFMSHQGPLAAEACIHL